MDNKKQKKIFAGVLILAQLLFMLPAVSFAQIPGIGVPCGTILLPCVTSDVNTTSLPAGGIGTAQANATIQATLNGFFATYQACVVTVTAAESGNHNTQSVFSLSGITSLANGGASQATLGQLSAAYQLFLGCAQTQLNLISAVVTPTSFTANIQFQDAQQINSAIQAYKTKLDNVVARLSSTSQSLWKTILVGILLQTSKSVADALVNHLVSNYKITNLKQYVDSAATLMYDNQFLRDNFPASQDQMMARQILTNPLFRSQIQPGIFIQANNNLGYNPATLSPSDPNYYTKLAAAGSSPANPYFLQASYVSGVDQSHAASVATAQAQISQGNGYKAPVNCAGSLAQQQQIDTQTAAAQALINNRQNLLTSLQNGGGSAANIAKAQADLTVAEMQWSKLPYTVTGSNSGNSPTSLGSGLVSGTNTEGSAAIVMCEAINSPAALVNQGINAVFTSLGANLAQYNGNNLPSYLTTIDNIASQFASSLVLGGITGAPVNISENQALNSSVAAVNTIALQAALSTAQNAQSSSVSGVNFQVSTNPTVPNGYSLSWTIATQQIPNASYVTIYGPGINGFTAHLPLSGGYAAVSAASGNFVLTVYSSSGQILTSASKSVTAGQSSSQLSQNSTPNSPSVAGAFTNIPSLNTRGPAVVITPRGE